MRFNTPLTQRLGIDIPIVQAPIGGASTPELVAAVSNAGGLGMLSITWRELNELRTLLDTTKSLTASPANVTSPAQPSQNVTGLPVIGNRRAGVLCSSFAWRSSSVR